jgi:hypothetical protein
MVLSVQLQIIAVVVSACLVQSVVLNAVSQWLDHGVLHPSNRMHQMLVA